jgi:hypothetical protein
VLLFQNSCSLNKTCVNSATPWYIAAIRKAPVGAVKISNRDGVTPNTTKQVFLRCACSRKYARRGTCTKWLIHHAGVAGSLVSPVAPDGVCKGSNATGPPVDLEVKCESSKEGARIRARQRCSIRAHSACLVYQIRIISRVADGVIQINTPRSMEARGRTQVMVDRLNKNKPSRAPIWYRWDPVSPTETSKAYVAR